jgi:hypothetical protein
MKTTIRAIALAAIAVGACGGAVTQSAAAPVREAAAVGAVAPPAAAPAPTTTTTTTAPTSTSTPTPNPSGLVIYTGGVSMLEDAERIPALIDRIIDLSEAMGGRLQARRDDGVTIRVPSGRFREAMTKLEGLGVVTHRSVTAEDVSEEFHDAEVRLSNLQATRKRLQEFLAKANDIPSTLAIERELERVSQEIDQLEGRMRFLEARATLSTIDVQIAAKPRAATVAATPAAPRKGIALPIEWLERLDADHLSTLQ